MWRACNITGLKPTLVEKEGMHIRRGFDEKDQVFATKPTMFVMRLHMLGL